MKALSILGAFKIDKVDIYSVDILRGPAVVGSMRSSTVNLYMEWSVDENWSNKNLQHALSTREDSDSTAHLTDLEHRTHSAGITD